MLPAAAFASQGSDTQRPDVYVVQAGDTLNSIADRTGVDIAVLMALNYLQDPDTIFAGAVLRLRDSAGAPAAPGTASSAATRTGPVARSSGPVSIVAVGAPSARTAAPAVSASQGAVQVPLSLAVASAPAPSMSRPQAPIATVSAASAASGVTQASVRGIDTPASLTRLAAPATVQMALQYMGSPYQYGGAGPSGFDCSGFVYYVENRAGRSVPRDLLGQFNAGTHPAVLEPGDILFFQDTYEAGLSHEGIYLGDGRFIHAIDESRGVGISSLTDDYWSERWYGATRLPNP